MFLNILKYLFACLSVVELFILKFETHVSSRAVFLISKNAQNLDWTGSQHLPSDNNALELLTNSFC